MSFPDRVAILLDGEYVRKVLSRRIEPAALSHVHVMAEIQRILAEPSLAKHALYRVLYYTAEPLVGTTVHPVDGSKVDFSRTPVFSSNRHLIDTLEQQPDVAVRRGILVHQGWEIGKAAVRQLMRNRKSTVSAQDVKPKIVQKGVDMRIGLDIATLTLKRLVSAIVVVAGDSDLVPALKFARTEGLRVYLDTLGRRSVRPELKTHADRVL